MGGFWRIEVKPGQGYPIEFPEDEEATLRITQATLGLGKSKERTIFQCTIGDKSPIFLCSLLPKKNESCPLNLEFEDDGELVTFSVIGDQSVHLSGYFVAYDEEEPVGEGYESDLCGEDVDESESGESSDFISDDGSYDMLSDDLDMYECTTNLDLPPKVEEIEDSDKPTNDKSQSKRLVKNGSVDNTSQHEVVKRGAPAPVLESEDEDGVPISTKINSQKPESATEQKDKVSEKNKKKKEKTSGDAAGMKRKGETIDQDQQESVRQKKSKKKNQQLHEGSKSEKEKQPEVLKNANEKSPDINMDSVSTETPTENKKNKNKNKKKAQKSVEKTNVDQTPSSMEKINGKSSKADQTPTMEKISGKSSKVKTFPNGLVVEEVAMGRPDGKRADPGKRVGVCYIGKLKNGKIFDSNMGKRPFEFKLGVGQVISGWDVGVRGMRVGDRRKLTIPPSMGYGQEGAPPAIPRNSWLIFDVEVVTVN